MTFGRKRSDHNRLARQRIWQPIKKKLLYQHFRHSAKSSLLCRTPYPAGMVGVLHVFIMETFSSDGIISANESSVWMNKSQFRK
jgi:hypothetical protein